MKKNNDFTQLLNKVESTNVDTHVIDALTIINSVSINETNNEGVAFTHYLEVEKELRKINHKIEENPELKPLYTELLHVVTLFARREYIREIEFNAKNRKGNDTFYNIDSTSQKDFYLIMKKIITLQALLGNKVNPKYKAIVNEVFEDFMTIVDEALVESPETLKDPVKFYKKEVSKCI